MSAPSSALETATDTKSPDPRTLTNVADILSCLSLYQSREAELSISLAASLSSSETITSSLSRLQTLLSYLDGLHEEASVLVNTVSSTADTAHRVGGRVRSLDEEMRRVREASERISQVIDLKSSLTLLQSSIESQDWETATRHCARAMALPLEVISSPFSEKAVPTPESPLPPAQTLQAAREKLLAVFRHNFEEASQSRDSAATSRFFKLFPAIGWEAEGLHAYADFVVSLVQVRAPSSAKTSSPLFYVTALTALFENIAMIVDQHQPVVEKYYGQGNMITVIVCLLKECDRAVGRLIEGWEEERSMKRKLADIAAFTPGQRSHSSIRKQSSQSTVEDAVDPREIDKAITEVTGMAGRWNLFRKFLSENFREDDGDDVEEEAEHNTLLLHSTPVKASSLEPPSERQPQTEAQLIEATASHKLFEDLLATYYHPLEVWYIRVIIEKAHRLSTPDVSQSTPTTTTPDDVFYVLKIVLSRLLSTGSVKAVNSTLESLREVVDIDFTGFIRRKLDDVYRTASTMGGASRGEKGERENRAACMVILNDLDLSSSHLERLMKDFLSHPAISQNFVESEQQTVKDGLSSFFSATLNTLRTSVKVGVEHLFNQLVRPNLRTFVPDIYKDISYVLDEDAYAAAEYNDLVRKRFIKAWGNAMDGYKDTLTETNFRLFFELAVQVLPRPVEKYVSSLKFTELGAVRFDRDLRSIMAYLSSQTNYGDIREKFLRLMQISTLLNLDSEEDVEEFYNGSGITWKLNAQEARAIAAHRI